MLKKKIKNHMTISKPMYDLNKDPDWQILRKSLMNKWICKPDWCCLKLRRFIGNMYTCHNNKLKITSNYLSSSGFRPGAINYTCVNKLKSEIFNEIKKRKVQKKW